MLGLYCSLTLVWGQYVVKEVIGHYDGLQARWKSSLRATKRKVHRHHHHFRL